MYQILVCDDDHDIVSALEIYLTGEGYGVTGAYSGQEAIDLFQQNQFHLVLMDIMMPGMDGIEATRRITRRWPTISILILTTYDEDDYAFGGLDAGASGFLLKDVTKHNLIDAVHAIANGDAILTPRITRQVLERGVPHPTSSQRQQEMRKAFDALTPRQREICALISEGLINEEIANQLTVEPASVKRAVTRILATLGLRNRTQIAIGWFKAGM